jgi:hypothetical protein
MNRKTIMALVVIVIIAFIFSSFLSNAIFNPSKKRSASVPVIQPISSTFPDVKSDPNYKNVFNAQALDPTQLIQIGTSQNATPFNSGTPGQ